MSSQNPTTPEALLEALIFAAPRPVSVRELSAAADLSDEEVEGALARLEEQLRERGVQLQRSRGRVQLITASTYAPYVERLLDLNVTLRFTQAAMETLAIVAYAQPVTRPQIESIRGVSSDSPMKTLLSAGMIEEIGRAESLGRPIMYGTTFEFLQQFGLQKPEDLPPLSAPGQPSGQDEAGPLADEEISPPV